MPLPLCNIHDLTLPVGSLEDDFIPALVYLFRGITTLNTLHITSQDSEEADNKTDTYHNSDTTEEVSTQHSLTYEVYSWHTLPYRSKTLSNILTF